MKTEKHITLFFILFLVAVSSLYLMLQSVPPETSDTLRLGAIYFLVFLSVTTLAITLGYLARVMIWPKIPPHTVLVVARRQGAWLGALSVSLLLLQVFSILNIWTTLALLLVLLLLELYAQ